MAEAYSSLVGDEDKYGRILTRNKKFLGVVSFGEGFPVQFSEIKVWDAATGIFENQNETPQMTNNPAESLNRVLKSNYDAGRISRSDLAEGLHNFFHARRLKMQVF